MNATTQSSRKSFRSRLKSLLHSTIALAFLFVPMIMLVQLSVTFASASVKDLSERGANAEIAQSKVSSDKATLFEEPVVSVTFDDGWRTIATNGAKVFAEHGVATTQYIIVDNIGDPNFLSYAQLVAFKEAGHEIGSHSLSHSALGEASEKDVIREMKRSKESLVAGKLLDNDRATFAYPYGSYSYRTNELGAPIYQTIRNTNATAKDGFNHDDVNTEARFDRTMLIGYTIRKNTSDVDIRAALDYTQQNNGWLVLTFHQVSDEPSEFAVNPSRLAEIFDMIRSYDIKTMTVGDALASREE